MFGRSGEALLRVRWVSLGSVVAVLVGAGGLLTASASDSAASSFVPITPCRLFDTRPTTSVGARVTPVGNGEVFTTSAWGNNGNCTIPPGATALSMNVVAVNGTSSSYLTVFPADQPQPLSSSLNWVAGSPPTPNAVTVSLSADGRVSFFNNAGTVDLAADLVGYYKPAAAGPAGPQGPSGPAGVSAPRPAQVIVVAKAGGDFTSVGAALASITDNSLFKPYLVHVAPGVYFESARLDLKDYVDIEGSGRDTTSLLCGNCGSEQVPIVDGTSAVLRASGAIHSEVRDLTVSNLDGVSTYNTAIWVNAVAGGVTFDHVGATSLAGAGRFAHGVVVVGSQTTLDGMAVSVTGAGTTTGILISTSTSSVVIRDANIRGGNTVVLFSSPHAALYDSVLNGATLGMSGRCFDVLDISLVPYSCA